MARNKKLRMPQRQFLYEHLRGTGRFITPNEASKAYGIQQLPARMSELRSLGLIVRTKKFKNETAYAISARDIFGSRANIAV